MNICNFNYDIGSHLNLNTDCIMNQEWYNQKEIKLIDKNLGYDVDFYNYSTIVHNNKQKEYYKTHYDDSDSNYTDDSNNNDYIDEDEDESEYIEEQQQPPPPCDVFIKRYRSSPKFEFLDLSKFRIPIVMHRLPHTYRMKISGIQILGTLKFYLKCDKNTIENGVSINSMKDEEYLYICNIGFNIKGYMADKEFRLLIKINNHVVYKSQKFHIKARRLPKYQRKHSDKKMWNPKIKF